MRERESAALGLISKPSKTESVCVCVRVKAREKEGKKIKKRRNISDEK